MPKRCSPKSNHGCGEMKSYSEFVTERGGYRKLCTSCRDKYVAYQNERKAKIAMSKADTGPVKGSAFHLFACLVKPCSV